jgi:hypothetical protein
MYIQPHAHTTLLPALQPGSPTGMEWNNSKPDELRLSDTFAPATYTPNLLTLTILAQPFLRVCDAYVAISLQLNLNALEIISSGHRA